MLFGYQILSEEPAMQAMNDNDFCGGQRSTEVKYSKLALWLPNMSEESVMIVSVLTLLIVKLGGDI